MPLQKVLSHKTRKSFGVVSEGIVFHDENKLSGLRGSNELYKNGN
jgi:hypothetical protein